MPIDASILRAYDIRGRVDRELTETTVEWLGQAIGSAAADAGQSGIVGGYDGREASPRLAAALRRGPLAGGRRGVGIGEEPPPVMYFATHWLDTQAGVVVTGSHNPAEYNGLKTIINGRPLWGEGITALGERIRRGDLVTGTGETRSVEVIDAYQQRITREIRLPRPTPAGR